MNDRYIPKRISDAVKKKHFFECSWCGVMLTDRHHIQEFSDGGKHTIQNLILLCPNCHRQTHQGKISKKELIKRIDSHKQGDRISGSIYFQVIKGKAIIGGNTFNLSNLSVLVGYDDINIIESQKLPNGKYSINVRFYDIKGRLIFWMNSNRYWTTSSFIVESSQNSLFIKNTDNPQYLSISKDKDVIKMKGINFLEGTILHFTDKFIKSHPLEKNL